MCVVLVLAHTQLTNKIANDGRGRADVTRRGLTSIKAAEEHEDNPETHTHTHTQTLHKGMTKTMKRHDKTRSKNNHIQKASKALTPSHFPDECCEMVESTQHHQSYI